MSAIAGIGTDLVKMARIEQAWLRHPERFPKKYSALMSCVFLKRVLHAIACGACVTSRHALQPKRLSLKLLA